MTPTTEPTTVDRLINEALLAVTRGDLEQAAALLDEAERLLLEETEAEEAA